MASHKIPDQLYVEGRTYQGIHKESNGYKLLASMGWKEGEGLGTSGQGIKEHISVKKKNDSLGIGQDKSQNRDEDWLQSMSMFDKVLSNLKEVKAEPKTTVDIALESNKKEASVTKKKRKSSKSDSCLQKKKDSQTTSKGVGKEYRKRKAAALVLEETTLGKSVVSHVGRFRRQEDAKSVCKYSAGDLSAILGGASLSQPKTSADTISEEKPEVQVEVCGPSGDESDSEKWWATKFVRAGTLQKPRKSTLPMQASNAQIKVHGFSEADQTQLYSQVQNAATSGRQGLGKSSVRKVAGGKTGQGRQTTFSSDDEDVQAIGDSHQVPNSDSQEGIDQDICMVVPGRISGLDSIDEKQVQKKPRMKSSTVQHLESKENLSDAQRIKNLRKLASKTLKVHGGQLKVAKLCKLVKKALNSAENQNTYCSDELKVVLKASKRFKVDGKIAIRVK